MADRQRPLRPRGGAPGGRRKRRVVIDTQAARPRPDARQQRDVPKQERPAQQQAPQQTGPVKVNSGATVKELSAALGVSVPEIIKIMMNVGEMVTITQTLSDDAIELIATESKKDVEIKHADEEELEPETYEDDPADLTDRPPVVTIMGHVDHGKTTLLDAIRESAVVETEAGGITQHIGAYQVDHNGRRITFLDTPGHEAFTALRARGAKVTDIAVLVVAADDGVMPQTVESINHARAAEVPIVVAVNKIDRAEANPQRVRQELVAQGLQPEDWGGTTQFADVSAKTGDGIDDLLERILLVADAELELQANAKAEASGPIIESRLDVGRGPVATMLVARGTLRVGDALVAGDAWGKVRALLDFRGEKVKEAGPGTPVEILGIDKPPAAGEHARVVENERQARQLAQARGQRVRAEQLARSAKKGVSLEELFTQMEEGAVRELNIIVKADVQGSIEAVAGELAKIEHPEVGVNVIHTGIGAITEGDVMLASASNAVVVGFNVRPNAEARQLAEREGVDLRTYRVIYQLTDDIRQALVGMLAPETHEDILGEAEVRALFRASRLGVIAGSYVTRGVIRRNAQVRVVREGTVVYETTISGLKRFKDDVREVQEGFECGILLDGFNDVKEGDVLEVYETRQIERTDLSVAGNGGAPDEPEADEPE
ncbi:MAG TPA: translation initiation factor IF-2 [Gaiellaceae bacterium]|nr:translation initiation factor IF-2 [Gaiellaceae bacterium]